MAIQSIQLTLLIGPTLPIPAPRFVMEALQGVEVTTSAGSRSGFQLTFSLSNRSPLHTVFLIAANASPLALRVILVATMNGTPNVLADGIITRQEIAPAQAGMSTLTITGEDLTTVMDRQEFNGIPYPAMPPEARVALIIAKYAMFGIIPLVIPSLFTDLPIPTDRIPSHEGTDLAYINRLAADVGHTFYIDPGPLPGMNTAYWGPQIKIGIPQPALNTDMDAFTNVESLTFNVKHNEKAMPIVFIQEPTTKVSIPIPIPDLNPLQPPLGIAVPFPTKFMLMKDTAKLSPMAAIGKGIAAAAESSDFVEGSGSLNVLRYGRLLKARQLVGVRGAGLAFDGLYYVKSVTSSLRQGEFKQRFSLTRNALVSITPVVPA
ncbi:MAG: hypothetical protein ABJC26_16375 [Gemmatimonadaceae bacterium]